MLESYLDLNVYVLLPFNPVLPTIWSQVVMDVRGWACVEDLENLLKPCMHPHPVKVSSMITMLVNAHSRLPV